MSAHGPGLAKALPPAIAMIRHGLNETADLLESLQRENSILTLENGNLLDEIHALRAVRDRARDLVLHGIVSNDGEPLETLDRLVNALAEVPE